MRIARIIDEKSVRLVVTVKEGTNDLLAAYGRYYEATYGEAIAQSALVEAMLRGFMDSDKAFAKFLDAPKGTKAEGTVTHQAIQPMTPAAPVEVVAPAPASTASGFSLPAADFS